ncbi:MAG: ATP-dependent DNA helicase, partial [Opitutae bacterium]|nr:ATP-dependent DNA helicase [Opitutae bacterium]
DWIRSQGKNPFWEISLPDAIIKFRQGLGRLIRNKTDTGLITILDSRIFTKQYGLRFLNTLPKKSYHRFNRNNRDRIFDQLYLG